MADDKITVVGENAARNQATTQKEVPIFKTKQDEDNYRSSEHAKWQRERREIEKIEAAKRAIQDRAEMELRISREVWDRIKTGDYPDDFEPPNLFRLNWNQLPQGPPYMNMGKPTEITVEQMREDEIIEQMREEEIVEQMREKELVEQMRDEEIVEQMGEEEIVEQHSLADCTADDNSSELSIEELLRRGSHRCAYLQSRYTDDEIIFFARLVDMKEDGEPLTNDDKHRIRALYHKYGKESIVYMITGASDVESLCSEAERDSDLEGIAEKKTKLVNISKHNDVIAFGSDCEYSENEEDPSPTEVPARLTVDELVTRNKAFRIEEESLGKRISSPQARRKRLQHIDDRVNEKQAEWIEQNRNILGNGEAEEYARLTRRENISKTMLDRFLNYTGKALTPLERKQNERTRKKPIRSEEERLEDERTKKQRQRDKTAARVRKHRAKLNGVEVVVDIENDQE